MKVPFLLILLLLTFCFAAVAAQVPSSQPLAVLTASDGQAGDGLGARVATDNQGAVFGYAINAKGPAIYVYQEPAGGWQSMTQTAVLQLPPSGVVGFLSASNDTLVVSLLNLGPYGSLYVFVKPASGWADTNTPTAVLQPTVGDASYRTVAISGNTIAAGETGCLGNGDFYGGTVVVFQKPSMGWQNMSQTAVLQPSDSSPCDNFGDSVSASGNTVVVGADRAGEVPPSLPGRVYVFVEPSAGWANMSQTAELRSSRDLPANLLGAAATIGGNTIFATGVYQKAFNIFVFQKPAGGWIDSTQNALLTGANDGALATNPDASFVADGFGALNGIPAVQVYGEGSNGWRNESKPTYTFSGNSGSGFGVDVAASANLLTAGEPGANINGNAGQGAIYLFGR